MLSACEAAVGAWYVPARMEAPDGELVRAIAALGADARKAEAELCRRFAPRIRLYGLRHLRDEDRARDLVQAVLLGVLVAAREGRIDDPERVARFMLGTCRNVALRMKQGDARTAGAEALDELADELDGVQRDRVDMEALLRCLGELDARSRRVVTLSFNEERPAEDVAGVLGTSTGNVRVIRHRAIAALRRCLDAKGAEASP
ncbi:MAG TPA: sigma-70 family RNA polymerase sigma factor [Polyangiaceae bacterium]